MSTSNNLNLITKCYIGKIKVKADNHKRRITSYKVNLLKQAARS